MDTKQAETRIIKILDHKNKLRVNNESILLDGPWGIGKTYTIENLSKNSTFKRNLILVSIFGKESIQDIENSIIFKLIPVLKGITKNRKSIKYARKATNDLVNKFSGINIEHYINMISVEDILSLIGNKDEYLICIDDLERISNNVDMKNLIGLIERLKTSFDVLIVSNTLKMDEKNSEDFNEYKEKVINHEIKIDIWSRETLVQILYDIELDQKNNVIDVYLENNESLFYRTSNSNEEIKENLSNIRVFKKYIELVLNTLDEFSIKKVNTDVLRLCKKVVYNYFFDAFNKKDLNINYNERMKLGSLNKILLYEELTEEEKGVFLDNTSEVRKDLSLFFQSYLMNEEELKKLVLKIKQKMSSQDKGYFINELNIISIFSCFEENELLNEVIKNDLINLAIDMYSPEDGEKHTAIMPSIMNDFDFKGDRIEASKAVEMFIKELNDGCDEKFGNYMENEVSKSKRTKDYPKLLQLTNRYKIKSIEEFEEIFDFFFKNLIDSYSEENHSNINKLIYATDSEIIRDFFTTRIKREQLITVIMKYKFFDEILNEKMYMENRNYYEEEPE